jgi:hypothetical protein
MNEPTELAGRIEQISEELRHLKDQNAIQGQIYRYAFLLDTGRWSEIAESIFTEDAVDYHLAEIGEAGTPRGRTSIKKFFETIMEGVAGTQHLMGNCHIEVTGDNASSRTYALCSHWLVDSGFPRQSDFTAAIYYTHRWRRTSAGWFAHEQRVNNLGPHGLVLGNTDAVDEALAKLNDIHT